MTTLPYIENGKLKWVESLCIRVIHNTAPQFGGFPCGFSLAITIRKPRAYTEVILSIYELLVR